MLDLTWKVFSQTGNIETYLLFKELEDVNESVPFEKNDNEKKLTNETMQRLF